MVRLRMKVNIPIEGKESRKFKVEIEYFDTYNLNHTLALVILPALKQIKKDSKSFPLIWVDEKDLPKRLRSGKDLWAANFNGSRLTKEEFKLAVKQSHWCLKKMIQAFDIIINESHCDEQDDKIVKKGLKLFAKYYIHLWY